MALALGKFTDAFVGADEKRKDRRAQNAQLYANWISANPDAGVDERKEHYNNLAGNSRGLQSGIPSEDTMKRQVKKYKDNQAKIAAANAQAKEDRALQQSRAKLEDITRVAKSLAPLFGDEANAKAQAVAIGLTSPDQFKQVYARMKTFAYADWNNTNKLLISDYLNDPTDAGLSALKGTTTSAELQTMIGNQYKGAFDREVIRQTDQARLAYQNISIKATTVEDRAAQDSAISAQFPLATVTGATTKQDTFFTGRMTKLASEQTADASTALSRAAAQAGSLAEYNLMVGNLETKFSDVNFNAALTGDADKLLKDKLLLEAQQAAFAAVKTVTTEPEWQTLRGQLIDLFGANFPDQKKADNYEFLNAAFDEKNILIAKTTKAKTEPLLLQLLTLGQTMNPDDYANAKQKLVEKAKTFGIVLSTDEGDTANARKAGLDATDAQQEFAADASGIAGDAANKTEYDRRIAALKANKADVLEGLSDAEIKSLLTPANELFTSQQADRDGEETALLNAKVAEAVDNVDFKKSVGEGDNQGEAIAEFMRGLQTGSPNAEIEYTVEQKNELGAAFQRASSAMMATISNLTNPTLEPSQMQATIVKGRKDWMTLFENNLTSQGIVVTEDMRLAANGGFDAIFANLRKEMNNKEIQKGQDARLVMEQKRGFTSVEGDELIGSYLLNGQMVGTGVDEKVRPEVIASLTASISDTISTTIEELGLPSDPYLVEVIMQEARSVINSDGQTLMQGSNLERKIDPSELRKIIFKVVSGSGTDVGALAELGGEKFGGIEQAAFNEAMTAVGISDFSRAAPKDMKMFRDEYSRLREVIRTSVFNVVDLEFDNAADRSEVAVKRLKDAQGQFSIDSMSDGAEIVSLTSDFSAFDQKYNVLDEGMKATPASSQLDEEKLAAAQEVLAKSDKVPHFTRVLKGEIAKVNRDIGNLRQALRSGMYPNTGVDSTMRTKIEQNIAQLEQQELQLKSAVIGLNKYKVEISAQAAAIDETIQRRAADRETELTDANLRRTKEWKPVVDGLLTKIRNTGLEARNLEPDRVQSDPSIEAFNVSQGRAGNELDPIDGAAYAEYLEDILRERSEAQRLNAQQTAIRTDPTPDSVGPQPSGPSILERALDAITPSAADVTETRSKRDWFKDNKQQIAQQFGLQNDPDVDMRLSLLFMSGELDGMYEDAQ